MCISNVCSALPTCRLYQQTFSCFSPSSSSKWLGNGGNFVIFYDQSWWTAFGMCWRGAPCRLFTVTICTLLSVGPKLTHCRMKHFHTGSSACHLQFKSTSCTGLCNTRPGIQCRFTLSVRCLSFFSRIYMTFALALFVWLVGSCLLQRCSGCFSRNTRGQSPHKSVENPEKEKTTTTVSSNELRRM